MKIISLNVNGFRSFYNRSDGDGILLKNLIKTKDPDIILFQEIKCDNDTFRDWTEEFTEYNSVSYHNKYKSGYAGVAALIKKSVKYLNTFEIINLPDVEYDSGRILCIEFNDLYILGIYTLNSGSDKEELRELWDIELNNKILELSTNKNVVILGDLNSTRDYRDCYNFDEYYDQYPGCYEFEINALNNLIENYFIDSYRYLHDEIKYSWFSYRGDARWTNKGWRLDYALVDNRLGNSIKSSEILGNPCEYSDHSPIYLELDGY